MNKKAFLITSICLLPGGMSQTFANPPSGGATNYQTIDAIPAQAYIANYKDNVQNKFAEFYSLDMRAVTNIVNNGATAIRLYNGLSAGTSKIGILVPVDVNYNNISGSAANAMTANNKTTGNSTMYSISSIGVCPPACDVTTSAPAATITGANAQAAANAYNSNGSYDSYNAFLIYPAALNILKNAGAIYFHVCNGINTSTGGRVIIYRGITAQGSATYLVEDASNMCNRCGL